jgi:rieske iron-sulfur protein
VVNGTLDSQIGSNLEARSKSRRRFLGLLIWTAVGGVMASVLALVKLVVPQKSGGLTPTVKAGDILIYAGGDKRGMTIMGDDLRVGDSVLAYPKGKESNYANLIRVIREKQGVFGAPTRIDWTDRGIVAYSAICTHLSCTVSWKKATQSEADFIICHCHNGMYDPLHGAKVIGGPPPRPLPQIAIKVDGNGMLRIMSRFAKPVGPIL